MAEKAFTQIKEAEAQAKAIIKSAQEEAAQIIKRAEEETAGTFLQFSETYSQQGAKNKQQIETDAQNSSNEYSKETNELCIAVKQKLSPHKSKAVDAVIQAITAQSVDVL